MALIKEHSVFSSPYYALIYIDRRGKLHQELSPLLAQTGQSILSRRVTNNFMEAVARSAVPQFGRNSSEDSHPASTETRWTTTPEVYSQTTTAMIPVGNKCLMRLYYEKAFQEFNQENCRVIAKAYIKLIEPRKQVKHPYNGKVFISGKTQQFDPDMTKPPWWPPGVTHREPDHLPKEERIRLLVSIVCDLRNSHNITSKRLREADRAIRCRIVPPTRLQILDEIYRVREEEEKFLDGRLGKLPLIQ
ncbi:hypothetical protein N7504_006291 [Penicillium tannophilum]|nr:hypothetical protein N7504_006291 [Penicillium tannophilum]